MDFPHGETVTVLTAGSTADPKSGDESAEDWTNATVEDYVVAVAPGGSTEPLQVGREQVDADFDLYFPPTANVTSKDRVVVRGLTCDVVGRPFLWVHPQSGWTPGLVVRASLSEG